MSTKSIADLDEEISRLQASLNNAMQEKNLRMSLYTDALSQRPAGIPTTWLPVYDEKDSKAVVTAWFNPDKYGTDLFLDV